MALAGGGASARQRGRGAASPSRETIATSALAYVDQVDLDSLSIRGLADGLGSFHANLYRRIASKDDLLDLVAARIYAEAGPPPQPGADNRAELIDYAHRLRAAWLAHPKAYPLLARQHPALFAALDGIVGALVSLGFGHSQVRAGVRDYMRHLYGSILMEALGAVTPRPTGQFVVSPEYPFLHAMQSSPPDESSERDHAAAMAEDFGAGVERILDGLAAQPKSRRRRTRP